VKVSVPSFAKLNLDLRVLYNRPDGYHELRTVFQTISLRDTLSIEFDFAKRTQIEIDSSVDIPDNLVVRSAKLVLDHLRIKAWVRFVLRKKIPMGAGLGGGSSNAAAVLLALPALAGKYIPHADLVRLGESLGSDVPFFLHGGTVIGLGRGTELYPLPDQPLRTALVVASGVHVSTPEAYRKLNRAAQPPTSIHGSDPLTSSPQSLILGEFQTVAWALDGSGFNQIPLKNDFEQAVFGAHPELAALARKLRRLGARPALMTGSGSALFGVFPTMAETQAAAERFPAGTAHAVRFVSRRQYRRIWGRSLGIQAMARSSAGKG
jgi:4-diphosphocytidyl-2-C-methyl-D-erythritol kinase